MGPKYYYYPITSNTKLKTTRGAHDKGHEKTSPSRHLDERPETPPLSRASSLSSSGPRTPTFHSVSPEDQKTRRRNVAFASPVAEAFRRPLEDELFVMRRFASHTHHCRPCEDALKLHSPDRNLCDRGYAHAKDLGQYFYCSEGKPFSEIDKKMGRQRVQVEVPAEYETIRLLFSALENGLNLRGRPKSSRPEIHQSSKRQSPSRSTEPYLKTETATATRYDTRKTDADLYEVRPSRTNSQRLREPVYQTRGDRSYETRTPYDEVYTNIRQTPIITSARTPLTPKSGEYYTSRSKDDGYHDLKRESRYLEPRLRHSKHSHRRDSTTRKRPISTYLMPYLSEFWR